ncbi:hypothetical protein FRC00_000026 [Tulasnella sp. 408]|nr:hypothetical protein FRC00_000026 [Tulasnella sp. 408]
MAMSKDELIDSHVSCKNAQTAIEAILKHASKQHELEEETEILGANEQRISLSIGKKRIRDIIRPDPRVITLAHPIIDPRKTSICLIVKDPQREYKDLLEKENIKFIGRVVGVSKLKGKFRGQPLPVNMGAKNLKSHLERAINNTLMNENKGHTVTVKIGHTLQSPKHVFENVRAALPAIITHIDGGWSNVQNVYITAPGASGKPGVSLPLWTCELGAGPGGRWEGGLSKPIAEEWGGLATDEPDAPSEPAISAGDDSTHDEVITTPEGKGKVRRFSESMGDPSMPPKKVAKTSKEAPTLEPLKSTTSASTIGYKSSSKLLKQATPSAKQNDALSSSNASKATRPNLMEKKNRNSVGGKASKKSAKERVDGTAKLLRRRP